MNGRDLNKNSPSCSVPFKEMVTVGSSSCRCSLLVGPLISCDFLSLSLSVEKIHCKKIARSQHLAKWRVVFCPIRWATKTHQTNFTTSILCNHKQNLEHIQYTRPLCCCSSSSSSSRRCCCCCSLLFLVASWFLVAPLVLGEPQLFMAIAVEIAIDLHHTFAEAEGADAQLVMDSLIRSKGYWRLVMRIFFRSSKLGKKYPKKHKKKWFEATFSARKNQSRITFDDWKNMEKRCVLFQKTTKTGCTFPLCLNHPFNPPSLCGTSTASLRNKWSNEKHPGCLG